MERHELVSIVRELRQKHQLTQAEMAKRLHVGKQAYERLENGVTQRIDFDTINRIAEIFQLSTIELISYRTPEGEAKKLLLEAIRYFEEGQKKIREAKKILGLQNTPKRDQKRE